MSMKIWPSIDRREFLAAIALPSLAWALHAVREDGLAPWIASQRDLSYRDLLRGFVVRDDDILRTARRLTPATGDMPEQYHKDSGTPVSTRKLSWSHAAFLAATDARAGVANL